MNTKNTRALTSIIIPCSNQLEYTRQCIRALNSHTRPPWELIVIDNGSTDRTADYLAGIQDGAAAPVTIIRNSTNLGFPAAINQGLKVARGEYLVLLNNDVVVTDSCSFYQGIYGHLARRNLAGLAAERGDRAEAARLWEAVLAECPGDREALAKLGRAPVPASVG